MAWREPDRTRITSWANVLLGVALSGGGVALAAWAWQRHQAGAYDLPIPIFAVLALLGVATTVWGGVLTRSALAWRRHAEAPWHVRADWRRNRVHDTIDPWWIELWAVAVLASVLAVALAQYVGTMSLPGFAAVAERLGEVEAAARAPAIEPWWPAAALAAAVVAVPALALAGDRLRFGESHLSLEAVPATTGAPLRGRVSFTRRPAAPLRATVVLRCSRFSFRIRPYNHVRHQTLWQAELAGHVEPDGTLAFAFAVPPDLPGTRQPGLRYVRWRLLVRAGPPLLGLRRGFTLPVFEPDRSRSTG